MAPGHVAYGLHGQYGLPATADTVRDWESGRSTPTTRELTALAGVLWCSVGDLLARATTLREHRLARGLAPEDLARRIGMDTSAYLRLEDSPRWRATDRRTAALAAALGLTPRELLAVTGRDEELAGLLRSAVTTRWQAYVRPVSKMLPVRRPHLEDVLRRLHADYHARMVATLSWGGSGAAVDQEGEDFLARIADHFWVRVAG